LTKLLEPCYKRDMERDINKLIEQVLAIREGENLIKVTSQDGQEVWVCLDEHSKSALELATGPAPIAPETFEVFRKKA